MKQGKVRRGQQGYRELLLCEGCEALISRSERYERRLFVDPLPPLSPNSTLFREHPKLDYVPLKLFFLSLLWRSSVSTLTPFRHVKLGPYEEPARQLLLNESPGSSQEFPVCLFVLNHEGQHLRDFFTEPTFMSLGGVRCYRFVVRGFVVFIFATKLPLPSPFPEVVLDPVRITRTLDGELNGFRFLRDVWNQAIETTKGVKI